MQTQFPFPKQTFRVEGIIAPEGVRESRCIDPRIYDHDTSYMWVVSFTPHPIYQRGRSPRYPLGPGTDLGDMKRKILPLLGFEHSSLCHPARRYTGYANDDDDVRTVNSGVQTMFSYSWQI